MQIQNQETKRIYTVNGKTYNSIEEMPPEIKKFFEDKDKDGRPDFIQEMMGQGIIGGLKSIFNMVKEVQSMSVEFKKDGKLELPFMTPKEKDFPTQTPMKTSFPSNSSDIIRNIVVVILIGGVIFLLIQYL